MEKRRPPGEKRSPTGEEIAWGGGKRRPTAFRASEISPLTEVGAAAVDDRFGPTSERGVDVDGDAAAWYQSVGFPSNSSLLWLQFFSLSLRSGNRFHLFGIYRIFSFNWEFKNGFGSRVVHF